MRMICAKCGGVATLTSRPNQSHGENEVYWRNYATCGTCGSTTAYEITGKVVFKPADRLPIKTRDVVLQDSF